MPNSKSPDAPLERPLAETALALASTLISQPCHHARQAKLLARRLATALAGQQDLAPLLIDARFAHPGWRSPLHRRLLGVWGACGQQSKAWAEGLNLSATDQARLQLLLRQLEDATAPSNTPICPRFMERLVESRGQSLQRGLRLLAQDIAFKRALPAQGPDGALLVGRDMACTPGEVVRCEPLYELIQYRPTTAAVRARPLLIIPPPLNRFYLLDMTPTSSLVRHALDQGLQVFLISWRNPNPSHCNWGLQAYTQAAADALHSARDITRSPQATLLGVCAGGLITLLLLGWLRARGEQEQIAAASFLVTPIDTRLDSDPLLIASP
jgi:polyhydroxyalkanoate synthase subunit PhaC